MAFELMQKTLDLIFPTLCLHCHTRTDGKLICQDCSLLLELLAKEDLVKYQYALKEAVITFAKIGVAETLFNHLQKGFRPLYKTAASYMVCQMEKEQKGLPDLIVPLPSFGGYKLNETLALELGKLMERPIKRFFLPLPGFLGPAFTLRKSALVDKKLLLVMALYNEKTAQKAFLDLQKKGFQNLQLIALCV
jgi:hypothetical protein